MRAMILAAGLGTRLRPLTSALPKPVLPVANRPLISYHFDALRKIGVHKVILNLHHLPEKIPEILGDGATYGVDLQWSYEPEVLGTGGGIKKVAHFLLGDPGPFVVLNGDALLDVDLQSAVDLHCRRAAVATMVLRDDPQTERYGALGVNQAGRIIDFVGRAIVPGEVSVRQGLFTGIHVLEPAMLELIPAGPCCINQTAYPSLIRQGGLVMAAFQEGFWSDVGTPERYLDANMAVLKGRLQLHAPTPFEHAAAAHDGARHYGSLNFVAGIHSHWQPPYIVGQQVEVRAGVSIGPSVCIGDRAVIGAGAQIKHTVIWPDATVPAGAQLADCIVWVQNGHTHILSIKES